eukprot:Sdes_comp18040_c0_seq3m7375
MGNNGEYEEFYVVISIEGLPVPDFCKKFEGNYCLLGLETSTPILKLGDQLFRGEHQDVLGTDLLFDKPSGNSGWKYFGKTVKNINFSKIAVTQKTPNTLIDDIENLSFNSSKSCV